MAVMKEYSDPEVTISRFSVPEGPFKQHSEGLPHGEIKFLFAFCPRGWCRVIKNLIQTIKALYWTNFLQAIILETNLR